MQCIVDYISFSVPRSMADTGSEWSQLALTMMELETRLPGIFNQDTDWSAWEVGAGRAPFSISFRAKDGSMVIFDNPRLNYALVEIAGRGCAQLHEAGEIINTLAIVRDRLTRLDIAADIVTDTRPPAFAKERSVQRFKSGSHINSPTGETVYVGSPKSDRFARVYRYEPPHPRADALRIEHVFRKPHCTDMANVVIQHGLKAAVAACGVAFGWSHALWDVDGVKAPEIGSQRPSRTSSGTVRWLFKQAVPAAARVIDEGELTLDDLVAAVKDALHERHNRL